MEKYKKFLSRIVVYLLIITAVFSVDIKKAHAMDAKAKAFLILSTYGAAGGGLLGLASMAFGEESIAIARGASLGLYAGMLFGGYVILSHKYKKKPGEVEPQPGEYQDPYTPYSEEEGEDEEGYDSFFSSPQRRMEFEENRLRDSNIYNSPFENRKGRPSRPPLYLNLVNLKF